jgi:hypothetical protein
VKSLIYILKFHLKQCMFSFLIFLRYIYLIFDFIVYVLKCALVFLILYIRHLFFVLKFDPLYFVFTMSNVFAYEVYESNTSRISLEKEKDLFLIRSQVFVRSLHIGLYLRDCLKRNIGTILCLYFVAS